MVPGMVTERLAKIAPQYAKPLSPQEREEMIQYLIWDFEVEGIHLSREEAELALERALSKPLPRL